MTIPGPDGRQHVQPALPAAAYTTYQISSPLATHWRPATCAEVGCDHYMHGWRTRVEGLLPADLHLATHCGRKFTKFSLTEGETWLVFEAGQPCFAASRHRLPVGRPERFIERGGDWRGNPLGDRRVHNADTWVDSFANHQDRLKTRLERG